MTDRHEKTKTTTPESETTDAKKDPANAGVDGTTESNSTKEDEERLATGSGGTSAKTRDTTTPTIEYLLKTYETCVYSDSWFEKDELYSFIKKRNNGKTILVNNSNTDLDFGGGGTNGAIRNYFWPDQKYIFYFMPRGAQSWHKWNSLAGGLHDLDVFRKEGRSKPCFTGTRWADRPKIRSGEVYYTPLLKMRRRNTCVEGILQAVGPRNRDLFERWTDEARVEHRKMCVGIVRDITRKCLTFASSLKMKNIVFSGISTGIFSGGDRKFAAAMRGAMLQEFSEYFKRTQIDDEQMTVVIIGRDWDRALF